MLPPTHDFTVSVPYSNLSLSSKTCPIELCGKMPAAVSSLKKKNRLENEQGLLKSISVAIFATVATPIVLYRVGVGGGMTTEIVTKILLVSAEKHMHCMAICA